MTKQKSDPADIKPVVKRVTNESVSFFLDEDSKYRMSVFNYIEFDNRLVFQMSKEYILNVVRNVASFMYETKKESFEIRFKRSLTSQEIDELCTHTHGSITIDIYKVLINLRISADRGRLIMSLDKTPLLQDEETMVKDLMEEMMRQVKYHEGTAKRLNQRISICQRWLNKKMEEKE